MIRSRVLPVALCLCLCAAGQTAADLRGIYIYTNDVSKVSKPTATALSNAFAIPGVDGVALVIGWDAIEPAMGQYQWATLDQWIAQIAALGRKIDLVVPAGDSIPQWLFQPTPAGAGAKALNFTISPHSGATGVCDSTTIAAPWDPAFLKRWDTMLGALAAHLKSAGSYSAITLVRLTGINRTTEELRLPAETPQSTGLACVSNAITIWQQAGYRPSLLLQAWNAIVESFQKSFPDKAFSVSIIPANPFPAIDENGAVITANRPDANQPLLLSASQKLPGRLVVQFDFLMPGEPASPAVIQAAQTLGTMAAFQTNEYFGSTGQGAACSEPVTNPAPCTASTFLELLETGVYPAGSNNALRAQYIEVFHANATAFPADILKAHAELAPPVISLVANAEGESRVIAPNTWVEIKGAGLALTGNTRIWKDADFTNGQLPIALDGVSVTINQRPAYVYYISPTQIDILTPPDALPASAPVQVTVNGTAGAAFPAQAQSAAPSFFVFNGGPYVAAVHADGGLLGPPALYPGSTTPAKPGETVVLYANGFGPTSTPIVSGSIMQSGVLSPMPVIRIGGTPASVQFAGLISPGLFQFNVVVPPNTPDGDQSVTAAIQNLTTQSGTLLTVQH